MINILFIGSIYSASFKKVLNQVGLPISSAGQTFESALVSGLDPCSNVQLICEYYVPCYPKFPQIYIKSDYFHHNENKSGDVSISFFNLPILKKISQLLSYFFKIKKNKKHNDVVIIYEVTSRQLLASVFAASDKKKIVIVPDLPQFMSDNNNYIYLLAKKLDRYLIDFALKRMDGFVLLSPFMKDKIVINNKPWMVLEGLYDARQLPTSQIKTRKKVLFYSGKIEKWFGLDDLLKAFTLISGNDYQLWLCGPGDIKMVNSYSCIDPRIIYKGCLSHDEVLKLQKQATILVNPRHSSDEFTLYSFPSKTMEYMASGTPTLMCKLKSLPDDYIPHLYLFDDESVEGMSVKIKECLDKDYDELRKFGEEASSFIIKNKNAETQASRLINFIKDLK